jgi:hypothetical protein
VVEEFVAAASDRFGMQSGDLGDPLETAVSEPHGFASGRPATLLLVQSTEQKIELSMIVAIGMFSDPAIWASALMNRSFRGSHRPLPPWSPDSVH